MKQIYFVLIFLLSLYLCLGGIANILVEEQFIAADNAPIESSEDGGTEYDNLEQQSATEEYVKLLKFFPFFKFFGSTISYLIILMAFGLLGAIIRIFMIKLIEKKKISEVSVYSKTAIGGLLGLSTVILSELIPDFKSESGNDRFYFGLAFICGIYTNEIFEWLTNKFKAMFSDS